jgi:hypothetical protein
MVIIAFFKFSLNNNCPMRMLTDPAGTLLAGSVTTKVLEL